MCVRELHHPLAEVRLDDFHAERLEIRIELDLFARHRFDLGHDWTLLPASGVPADLPDDVSSAGGSFRKVDLPAYSFEPFSETLNQLGQSFEVGLAALLQVGAAGREVEALEGGVAPAAQAGHRVDERALQLGVV